MKKITDLGEFALIDYLTKKIIPPKGVMGVGDDCAVVPVPGENGYQLFTTDAMVEGVHFRTDFSPPADIGWKLLSVSISDIAAMGGMPQWALITAQLKPDTDLSWIENLYDGLDEAAKEFQLTIIGGDTVAAPINSFSSTVIGSSLGPPRMRQGANVGDDLWLSGEIGAASFGLMILERKIKEEEIEPSISQQALLAHQRPWPQVQLGRYLLENHCANAMIDLSDGLFQDASHIARQSNVSLEISLLDLPIFSGYEKYGVDSTLALTGGEDYQLLFTAPQTMRTKIAAFQGENQGGVFRIGSVISREESPISLLVSSRNRVSVTEWLVQKGLKAGFDHFR